MRFLGGKTSGGMKRQNLPIRRYSFNALLIRRRKFEAPSVNFNVR